MLRSLYQDYLQPDRRLEILIQAAAFLDQDIIIVLLGSEPEETVSELKSLIVSEKVSDWVKIIPAVPCEELLNWTVSADIGLTVLPPDYSLSIQKCFKNKFFKYMMAGLPVLSSNLDAIAEAIKNIRRWKGCAIAAPQDLTL